MKFRAFSIFALLAALMAVNVQAAEQPYELTMAFFAMGNIPPDLGMVQDEINKVAISKINVKVKLLPIALGAWKQQMNLMLASGEKLDLLVTGVSSTFGFSGQVAKNQLLPLDELLAKNGKNIGQSVDKSYIEAGKIEGKLYGIPTLRDMAASYGIVMRKSILDKYKIDVSKLKTFDDVENLLRFIKEKEPGLIPLMPGAAGVSLVEEWRTWDPLGEGYGALMNFGADLKVTNVYETPEYKALVNRFHSWYKAGLIYKDAAINKDHPSNFIKADKLFAYLTKLKPGIDQQESNLAREPLVSVELVPPLSATNMVANIMWAIPRNSKAPEKAMEFLNLMYGDKEIINLFCWGIEGKHYVKTADGRIDFPKGVDAATSGYNMNLGWEFGNQLASYVFKPDSPTLWADLATFNKRALRSKALGFMFDSSDVKTEYAAVANVMNQYRMGLECGLLDPDEVLPVFIQKLKAAGLYKIIAEKQKQLDAWAKAAK